MSVWCQTVFDWCMDATIRTLGPRLTTGALPFIPRGEVFALRAFFMGIEVGCPFVHYPVLAMISRVVRCSTFRARQRGWPDEVGVRWPSPRSYVREPVRVSIFRKVFVPRYLALEYYGREGKGRVSAYEVRKLVLGEFPS